MNSGEETVQVIILLSLLNPKDVTLKIESVHGLPVIMYKKSLEYRGQTDVSKLLEERKLSHTKDQKLKWHMHLFLLPILLYLLPWKRC